MAIDFRIDTPLQILLDGCVHLLQFKLAKLFQGPGGLFAATLQAVQGVELIVGPGQIGVEPCRCRKMLESSIRFSLQPEKDSQVVMGDRFVGNQLTHLLKLLSRTLELTLSLVSNAQIEPGVRNLRGLLLHLFQLGDPFLGLTKLEQGQSVVEAFAG